MVATSTRRDTPARWAAARTRAAERGTRIFQDSASGQVFATGSDGQTIYRVGWDTCDCRAAAEGDPICQHRAAFREHCQAEDRAVARMLAASEGAVVLSVPAPAVCPDCHGEGTFRTYYGDHLSDYVEHVCHCRRAVVA